MQQFQNAWIVQDPTVGVRVVPDAVWDVWSNWGRQAGTLGMPVSDPTVPGGTNYSQVFQGGTITVTGGVGALTATSDPWFAASLSSPWLGASLGDRVCTLKNGGCYQPFVGGWLVQSSAGAFGVPAAVRSTWLNWGRDLGILGYPAGAPSANPATGNYSQVFQGGTITVTGGVGALTATSDPWFAASLSSPWLGASLGDRVCTLKNGGCYQPFVGGWLVQSSAGAFGVPAAVRSTWLNWGRDLGILGYPAGAPSANPATGNYSQVFQGGTITVTGGVGALTATSDPWFAASLSSPWLGASLGDRVCTLKNGGCYQPFVGGWLVQSSAGAFGVPAAVRSTWLNWGRDLGILGYPAGAPSANPATGNYSQVFQGGTITVTGGVGALTATSDPWFAASLSSPWLGASLGDRVCTLKNGGCYQPFVGGWLVQSSAGAFGMPAAVRDAWIGAGREGGVLGYPTSGPSQPPSTGSYSQRFQGGTVTVSGGRAVVTAP